MNDVTFWLGRAGAASVVLGAVVLGAWLFAETSPVRRALQGYERRLRLELDFLRSSWPAPRVVRLQLLGAALALVLVALGNGLCASLVAIGVCLPPVLIKRQRAQRVERVGQQIEGWLAALASALRATPSLGEALRSTSTLLQEPIAGELDLIFKEYQLGLPLDRALSQAAERIGSSTFRAAVSILKTARKAGGNLPDTLGSAAANLREMARLEGVVRTKTAEGKAQAFVISAVPFPLYFGIRLLDPQFFVPLETTFMGHVLFSVAGVIWLVAFVLSRKILQVDI